MRTCPRTQCQQRQESLTVLALFVRWSPNPAVRCGKELTDLILRTMHLASYGSANLAIWFAAAGNYLGTRTSSIRVITSFAGQTVPIGLSISIELPLRVRLLVSDSLVGSIL